MQALGDTVQRVAGWVHRVAGGCSRPRSAWLLGMREMVVIAITSSTKKAMRAPLSISRGRRTWLGSGSGLGLGLGLAAVDLAREAHRDLLADEGREAGLPESHRHNEAHHLEKLDEPDGVLLRG